MPWPDETTPHPSTGGDYVRAPNPLGGAPLFEYSSDGRGSTGARPIGLTSAQFSDADSLAFSLATTMFDGATLQQAQSLFAAFTDQARFQQELSMPGLGAGQRAYLLDVIARDASIASRAMTILQTGRYEGGAYQTPVPQPGEPVQAAPTPVSSSPVTITPPIVVNDLPPVADPVIPASRVTSAGVSVVDMSGTDIIRRADPLTITVEPPAATPTSATAAASGGTTAPPAAAPTAATSAASGTPAASSSTTKIAIIAAVAAALALVLSHAGGSHA